MPGLLGRVPIKLYAYTSTVIFRFVLLLHMIVVAPLLVPCGSLRGGHLGYQHDAHILSYRDAARSVPRAPHYTPRDFRHNAYLRITRVIAREVRCGDPRDHSRVDSRDDSRDVPRRLPKTSSCTERDDVAIRTAYQTTNSSDSERSQKSDLGGSPTAYCAMFNIAILTPVGDALLPSLFDSSVRAST